MVGGYDETDLRIAEQLVKGEPETVEELLEVGQRILGDSRAIDKGHDNDDATHRLLELAVGEGMDLDPHVRLPRRRRERYLSYVARRAAGEPLGLIVGNVQFCGLRLKVSRGVFLPRSSSELSVSRTLHHVRGREAPRVVDIGTGVGAIALAVASARQDADTWGCDISDRALSMARRNARDSGVANVTFRRSDLFAALPSRIRGSVDVIVGYVPHVAPTEIPTLPGEVSEYEPLYALSDLSPDGLALLQRVCDDAATWLRPGGWLLLQLAEDTAAQVREACIARGMNNVNEVRNAESWDVLVEAQRPR